MHGPELVSFGSGGKSYWAQRRCKRCRAWLSAMPDSHQEPPAAKAADVMHEYTWKCRACGAEDTKQESSAAESWAGAPEEHAVGTVDPSPERDPDRWRASASLTEAEKGFVRAAWAFLDATWPAVYVHRAIRFMELEEALIDQNLEDAVGSASLYIWGDESATPMDYRTPIFPLNPYSISGTPIEVWEPLLLELRSALAALDLRD
jgi:hypothetical protein